MFDWSEYKKRIEFNKADYLELRTAIRINNYRSLRTLSFIVVILFATLFTVSFFSHTDVSIRNHLIYGCLFFSSAIVYVITPVFVKKHPHTVALWMYFFMLAIHIFGIIIGAVSQTKHPATTYIVMLFVIPIMFVDRPSRTALFNLLSATTFLVCSYLNKEYEIFFNDLSNVVSFYILGLFCGRYFTTVKMDQLKLIKMVEAERDTDTFTGVLTKTAFLREFKRLLSINNSRGVFVMIDVDNFKTFNDTYGHEFGDQVLITIGDCMRNSFRQSDLLGRFGGDEFFVFIPSTNDTDLALFRAKSLQMHLADQIKLPDSDKSVTLSIGISNCKGFGETTQSLFKRADEAIYEAKANGKNTIVVK